MYAVGTVVSGQFNTADIQNLGRVSKSESMIVQSVCFLSVRLKGKPQEQNVVIQNCCSGKNQHRWICAHGRFCCFRAVDRQSLGNFSHVPISR
jgi:hypothetical protein